jgi:hypothetical protein
VQSFFRGWKEILGGWDVGELGGALSQVPTPGISTPRSKNRFAGTPAWGTRDLWGNWRKATAKAKVDPSTHHPRTEIRSGPRSLRMTPRRVG